MLPALAACCCFSPASWLRCSCRALRPFALVFVFVGGAISMIGIYLANRWVRKPRPEESLDKALKSFDDGYRLYHYPALPSDHILLTPTGLVAMEVVNLAGSFSYRKGRWRESMTIGRALRYLVEPRVNDPRALAEALTDELKSWFHDHRVDAANVPVKVLTVFTHPAVDLQMDEGNVPALVLAKLRKQASPSAARLSPSLYEELADCLERATVG